MGNFDKINMIEWLKTAPEQKKGMPVLSFPGTRLLGIDVEELVFSGEKQAQGMIAIAEKYDTLASLSMMDLSVEAEAFGCPVRYMDDEVPTVSAPIVNSPEDAEALQVPPAGSKRTGEYIKAIEIAKREIKDRPVFAGTIGPFSLAARMMDVTEIMIQCFVDPEAVHKVVDKSTKFLTEYIKEYKKIGANGVVIAEPAAGLLSPQYIGEFSSPYVKRIIEAVEEEDFLVIYHNCGKVIPLVKEILETGARAFHFGNTIKLDEILPLIPSDKIVMGNVDPASRFRSGTPESVREATLDVLDKCSKYPNFIISSGCDIPPASPIENIDAFFATIKEYYGK